MVVVTEGPVTITEKSAKEANTEIGPAQKDMAREIGARLTAIRPMQFLGVLLILAALAMFHPVVRAVTQSTTLQAVTGGVGLLLVFAPMVIAGHERLLIVLTFVGVAVPVAWYVAHRHGRLQGVVDEVVKTKK